MSKGALVVTGTDTDAGKTVVAAGLTMSIAGACYWKPVQAGIEPTTDMRTVQKLTGLPVERFLPEAYRLKAAVSPHLAARMEDTAIDPALLNMPDISPPLIIEGAGGVMVPLSNNYLMLDLFARWNVPVILVARTTLGTINHSLLSIAALRSRDIRIGGLIFSGDPHEENERVIPELSGVQSLGRLPRLDPLDPEGLHLAMQAHIDIAAVEALLT